MIDTSQFTSNDKYLMLALDHRGSIKRLINSDDPETVADEQVINLKKEIINSLEDQFSGLLIDVEYGLKAYQSRAKQFLLPVEKSGYRNENGARITELEYSAQQLIDFGANGAKVLFYFNPDVPSAHTQLDIARQVLKDCQKNGLPLFLEIVTYVANPGLSSQFQSGIVGSDGLVIESVRAFKELEIVPSVWKLEYPGDLDACREVTNLVEDIPWILLTGGDNFETFKSNLEDAVKGGARGFLAGRALWQEVCRLVGKEKENFLKETLPERFRAIVEITKIG